MSRASTIFSEAWPTDDDAPRRCQLVVIDGPDRGRAARLDERVVVGTGADCQLQLTDDRVSEEHLDIVLDDGRYVVTDRQSKNGTMYEGSLVSRVAVPPGATLKLGRSFVRIQPLRKPLDVEPSQARRFGDLVGVSLSMREVFAVLELAAQSTVTVLLEGETGTGKELAARAIHEASDRAQGPFVAIDCGALPETLLESELFGHARGAFTGAANARRGAFARADGGTIFLDEMTAVPAAVQSRLLRVLEERKVRPVGADKEQAIDVRVVAASRVDLEAQVAAGDFRPDLLYRLSVLKLKLPTLASRREDIPLLVQTMLEHRGFERSEVVGDNLSRLVVHDWPGNVRELRNVIDRALALSPGAESFEQLRISVVATLSDDPLSVRTDLPYAEAKQSILHAFETKYLKDVFTRCDGNIAATAREAKVDRKHLRSLLQKHGLLSSPDEE